MKVRCEKLINQITGEPEEISHWLTIGKVYVVLGVYVFPERDLLFRVMSDENVGHPVLANGRQFVTICPKVPSNWIALMEADGRFYLTPQSWSRKGFWEQYFDGD